MVDTRRVPRRLSAAVRAGAAGSTTLLERARLFVRLERRQYVGALHPSMWRRGFLSNRLYAYPGVENPDLPYISDFHVETRLEHLNGPAALALLDDKNVFADMLVARGLAAWAPAVYGAVVRGTFRPRSARSAERMRAEDHVVLKPVRGAGGRGLQVVHGAQVEHLSHPPTVDLVVQEKLRQHAVLAAINPASLNTLRVLAVRLPEHGPLLAAAVHRWGTAATGAVDNVSSGGLCSLVDLETGVLSPAVGRPRQRQRIEHHRHPDTGTQISGVRVPQWDEVRDLALRLMAAFPELDHVGWDLCVTEEGPRVVEGNPGVPNLNVFQFHGPFVHDARLRRYYAEHGLLPADQ